MSRARLAAVMLWVAMPALAAAQRGAPPLSQWHHTSWTGEAGPPRPGGDLMQRSPDGYLWLNSANGLMRFDGVRFTFIDSTIAPEFRAGTGGTFFPRHLDSTGAMSVQGPNGLFLSYRDGRFQVAVPKGSGIQRIEQDGSGRLWARSGTHQQLLTNGVLGPAPLPPGVPDTGITVSQRDAGRGMWLGTRTTGVWHVTGTTAEHYAAGRVMLLRPTSDGGVWANIEGAGFGPTVYRLAGGKWFEVRGPNKEWVRLRDVIEAPDGSIWLGTNTLGVMRWRDGVMESFSRRNGLSSDNVNGLFVDSEGAVWVVTAAGIDRLRPSAFVSVDSRNGVPENVSLQFQLDVGGAIWTKTQAMDSVVLLEGGPIGRQSGRIRSRAFAGPPNGNLTLLCPARAGGVWVAPSRGGLVYYTTSGTSVFDQRHGLPPLRIMDAIELRDGSVWVEALGGEFGRLRNGRYREIKLPSRVNRFVEDKQGRLWITMRANRFLLALRGDSIVTTVTLPMRDSVVQSLTLEGGDTLWVAGTRSLVRVTGGRAIEVHAPALTKLFVDGVSLAVTNGQLWITGGAGLARVQLSVLHRAANGESPPIEPKVFGPLDGIPGGRVPSVNANPIQVGPDGRVWVNTPNGFAVGDPSFEFRNGRAPLPRIEELSVGGLARPLRDGGTIPPNPNQVAIRFAAPMLGLPELGRVEYRLDGSDTSWVDGKPPRVAMYNHLRPGRYRFRVRAWNEDGVPSAGEATLSFRVLPAWYQAWWFFALGIFAVASMSGGAVAVVQRRRSAGAARDAQARFDAVLAERTRMARELHDTLMQGFTGITLQLDTVRDSLAARAEPAANRLGDILRLADRTLREAREMVWDMRQPGATTEDLGESLRATSRELTQPGGVELRHSVEGVPRQLPPVVVTTLLRIAKEAVANAMKHAKPSSIDVRLIYEPRRVRLEISDDGSGSDLAAFDAATARGHWGVAGMHERARAAGGTVVVTSAPGQGTRISCSLPAEPVA